MAGAEAQRLAKILKALSPDDRKTLLDFAEFLQQRSATPPATAQQLIEPNLQERPQEETVVAAIRRLKLQYHMLQADELLHATADLMTDHLLKGRAADDVINELERLFDAQYARYRAAFEEAS